MNIRYFKTLTLLAMTAWVAGCATQKDYVSQTRVTVVQTPGVLLQPCAVTPPVSRLEYMKKTLEQREGVLADLTMSLYKDLKVCNDQIAEIKGFQQRQLILMQTAQETK